MNKCKECPFRYIDFRKNWKCRLDIKVVNAYGCEKDLAKEKLKWIKRSSFACCPKCDSKGIVSPLLNTGKCSNKDCDFIYKNG